MHFTTLPASKAFFLLFAASSVNAFWRMPCLSRSGLARMDPIVSPGSSSSHAHAIHGSSGFSETSAYADLRAGECTSCEVAQDKSAYWTPALYFQNAAGDFKLVQQVGGMLAYYLLYPNVGNTSLSAFPQGFQMIAGDSDQRNFTYPVPDPPKSSWSGPLQTQAFLRQAALGFNCLNYAAPPEGSLYRHFLPDKAYLDANCHDGVRFELMFPSCWNGVDLDSPNHKDHVAYPDLVMTGNCPDNFPIRLVSLFYETIWNTYEFVGQAGQFVLSNGDPTGYGYHGDFVMGWDETFLQQAVDTCTNLSGEIQDCPLFTIQDAATYSSCNITVPPALQSEDVVGSMPSLPGNQQIFAGPGYAAGAAPGGANPVPTLSHSPGAVLASTDTYVPGAVFAAVATASPAASLAVAEVAAPAPTPTPPPVAPDANAAAPSYFSTAYSTTGQEVVEVLWVEEYVTVTASQTSTIYIPAARERKRHFHQHRSQRRRE